MNAMNAPMPAAIAAFNSAGTALEHRGAEARHGQHDDDDAVEDHTAPWPAATSPAW